MDAIHQVVVALVFHGIDLASGLIAAVKNGDLQSAKMRDGLFKKLGFVLAYLLAYLLDTEGGTIGLQLGISILPVIITYAVTTETVSILENISRINPDLLPAKLMNIFHMETVDKKEGEKIAEHPEGTELGDTDSE